VRTAMSEGKQPVTNLKRFVRLLIGTGRIS